MARDGDFLQIQLKQIGPVHKSGFRQIRWTTLIVEDDKDVDEENILQYEFYNMGTTYVRINDFWLMPGRYLPVTMPWQNSWVPAMQDKEIDRTVYRIRFFKVMP